MKKLMILITIILFLLISCNLDSNGVFAQIYIETEKNNIIVDYLVGVYQDDYYFSTKKNSLAKYSLTEGGSNYSNSVSVSGAKARFITNDGYAVCSKMDEVSSYFVANIRDYNAEPINLTILVDGKEVVLAGEYFNDIGGAYPLTLLLKRKADNNEYFYYLYYGEQPNVTIDSSSLSATINFSDLQDVTPSEAESSPSIIGPGKITYSTYSNETEQDTWKIDDRFTFSSRPLLWMDNLLILRSGKVFTFDNNEWTEVSADTDSLTNYDGDVLISAGYDDDGTLYGITDRFSFKFSAEGFKTTVKSVNMTYIGLIKTASGFKAATTENGVRDFDISQIK